MKLYLLLITLVQTIPEQPLQMIEKYGIMSVMVILMIGAVVYLFKKLEKKYKVQDATLQKLQEILAEIAKNQAQQAQPKTFDDKDFSRKAELATKVNTMLYNLMSDYGSDRISIYEFHNGGKTLYGVDFNKASCTYEANRGTESRTKDYQQIPISTNVLWNAIILSKDSFYIKKAEDLENVDQGLYFMLKVNNIKSYYANLLIDLMGRPIGIIAMEYTTTVRVLTESELDLFKNKSFTIGGMMLKEHN